MKRAVALFTATAVRGAAIVGARPARTREPPGPGSGSPIAGPRRPPRCRLLVDRLAAVGNHDDRSDGMRRIDVLADQLAQLARPSGIRVGAAVVGEARRDRRAAALRAGSRRARMLAGARQDRVSSGRGRRVLRLSLAVIISSWIFSPGRMPTIGCSHSGPIASATSSDAVADGILGTKISPPQRVLDRPQHHVHAFLQRDVEAGHRRIGDRQHAARRACSRKNGMTEPRLPITLP